MFEQNFIPFAILLLLIPTAAGALYFINFQETPDEINTEPTEVIEHTASLDTQQTTSTSTKATDYNSSRSNRTTASGVNQEVPEPDPATEESDTAPTKVATATTVDMDTESSTSTKTTTTAVDNDCNDPHGDSSTCAPGDPIPGIGITAEQSGEVSKLDDDSDGDSISSDEDNSTN